MQVRRGTSSSSSSTETGWSSGRTDGCGEASRKRRGQMTQGRGGAQPDPGSMVDDSMSELRREAEALGADAVAPVEAYSSTSRQRDGPVWKLDLRLGWDLGQRADQVKAEERLSDEKPHLLILSPMCLSLSLSTATRQARRVGRLAGAGQTSFGVCMQSSKIANRARWTRSLRVSLGGIKGALLVEAEVD